MMAPVARRLGERLHLQHGPIDLIIGADGARDAVFAAAERRFATLLTELVEELALLKTPNGPAPQGETAAAMHRAVQPFHPAFVTPMAAVAGAVSDTILAAMVQPETTRAYVNNGGDIAVHLTGDTQFTLGMADHRNRDLGRIVIHARDQVRAIATSGRHGRSLSLGIADSVTVLAQTAAQADVAATMIANSVDLPDCKSIQRKAAHLIVDDSDLGAQLVVTDVAPLSPAQTQSALNAGATYAKQLCAKGHIHAAALFLNDASLAVPVYGDHNLQLRTHAHA